jgi:pimeloyl-ACP methyl ester carboxylesterase
MVVVQPDKVFLAASPNRSLLAQEGTEMNPETKPTIVLVHGAFADSSSWAGVTRILLAEGYPVVAASNPLRGVKNDADYVSTVISSIQGPVVLVGHSYGGMVISNAVQDNSNVQALVYVDAFAPEAGARSQRFIQAVCLGLRFLRLSCLMA